MARSKIVVWSSMVAGFLWILAGMRDLFAPGFLSISGQHPVSGSRIALSFAIGIMFLVIAVSWQATGRRRRQNKS